MIENIVKWERERERCAGTPSDIRGFFSLTVEIVPRVSPLAGPEPTNDMLRGRWINPTRAVGLCAVWGSRTVNFSPTQKGAISALSPEGGGRILGSYPWKANTSLLGILRPVLKFTALDSDSVFWNVNTWEDNCSKSLQRSRRYSVSLSFNSAA